MFSLRLKGYSMHCSLWLGIATTASNETRLTDIESGQWRLNANTHRRTLAKVCRRLRRALPTSACCAGVGPLTLAPEVAAVGAQTGTKSGWLKFGFSFVIITCVQSNHSNRLKQLIRLKSVTKCWFIGEFFFAKNSQNHWKTEVLPKVW